MNAISEIAVLLRNGKSVRQSAELNGLPITRIVTIADGTINPAKVGFADLEESDCTDWLLQDGDILISHINSTKHLGKCAIYQGDPPALIHGMNLLALRVDPDVAASRYVYWMLSSTGFRRKLPRITKDSVNQSSFNISSYKKLEIPLPPLAEQRRIARILDAADALRAKRREALAQLDTLVQSTFLDMFGDPVTNPMGWEQCVVGDVVHAAKDGPHVSPTYAESGVPFLSTRHIKPGEVVWEDLKYIDQDEANRQWKKCKPEFGDILYTKGGTTGIAARVTTSEPFAVWVHVALLKLIVKKVHPIWIEAMLNSAYCYTQSQRYTHGIANRDLGLKRMIKIQMYLPPLAEQRGFAAIVESIEQQKASQRAHMAELDTLFASLQSRAFRGDL